MSERGASERAAGVLLDAPPPSRPTAPSQPCAACGALIDPLRAAHALAFEDGLRFLCSDGCLRDHRGGARHRGRAPEPRFATPATGSAVMSLPPPAPVASEVRVHRGLWVGAAAAALAAVLGVLAGSVYAAIASAGCATVAALCALWASVETARDVGWVAWALGPVGVGLAAAAAQGAAGGRGGSWLLFEGVALAAGAVVARAWFDAEARTPVEAATQRLIATLPSFVHVPVHDAASPLTMAVRSAPASTIRTSDDIVARRGDTIAVDGVVQAGEARVRTHAAAPEPVRRTSGDPVLAGAFVAKGALRVRALRVGDDRAFVRLARFGKGGERDPAPIARAADVVIRWGGLTTVGLALIVLAATESGGLPRALSAAAAVLLAAPLLAVRRASDSPLVAAATAAAARGIVFQSARALDAAGRVSVVAVAPRGTLTAGRPELVEVHRLGDDDLATLIALAAGAERVAGEDPIARAVLRYADTIGVRPAEVRRPTYSPGRGVTGATEAGQALAIGSRRLLLDEGISVAAADAEAALAQARGRTPVFVSVERRVRAVISIEDELRGGARPAIQRIFDLGAEVVLLTGEERRTVEQMAASLDVTHVKAELLPEERGDEVRNLRAAGGVVAVIGKAGVDDAALAAANVGVVLSQAGGHAGEHGVALVGDDVGDAVDALWIARAARDGALGATRLAAVAFGLIVAAAAAGLVVPGIAAVLAVGVDAYGIRAGARLLHRIALRLPPRG